MRKEVRTTEVFEDDLESMTVEIHRKGDGQVRIDGEFGVLNLSTYEALRLRDLLANV